MRVALAALFSICNTRAKHYYNKKGEQLFQQAVELASEALDKVERLSCENQAIVDKRQLSLNL